LINCVGRGGRRRSTPRAFTEQGVAMLSSVLRSERAIAVNIMIMRTFVRLPLGQSAELRRPIAELELRLDEQADVLGQVMEAIQALSTPTVTHTIGFRVPSGSNGHEDAEGG
jgi:hypothetical protein